MTSELTGRGAISFDPRRTNHVTEHAAAAPVHELFGAGFESGSAAHTIRRPLLSAT